MGALSPFPIVIPVDGRGERFTAYVSGRDATATGHLERRWVTVDCSIGLLRKLRLTRLDGEGLSPYFDRERPPSAKPWKPGDAFVGLRQRERNNRKTTPQLVLEALNGHVLGVSGQGSVRPHPWYPAAWDGWAGDPQSLHVGFIVGRWDDVMLATSRSKPDEKTLVSNLLSLSMSGRDRAIHFPLDLSVARTPVSIAIDGTPHRFTAYLCGTRAKAVCEYDGVYIQLDCPVRRLEKVSLKNLTSDEIREHLKRSRYRTAWSESALQH